MSLNDRTSLVAKLGEILKSLPDDDLAGVTLSALIETGRPLPLDSMAMLDFSMLLEDSFGVRLTDEQLVAVRDPRRLVEILSEALGVDR